MYPELVHGNFDYSKPESSKLEPVIQIFIRDCSLFPEHKRFFSSYVPRDDEGCPYTDKLQFIVTGGVNTDVTIEPGILCYRDDERATA